MNKGTPIRFTVDNLGTLELIGHDGTARLFAAPTVRDGDIGTYWRPDEAIPESGWHLALTVIAGTEYAVPVHESMFEVVDR